MGKDLIARAGSGNLSPRRCSIPSQAIEHLTPVSHPIGYRSMILPGSVKHGHVCVPSVTRKAKHRQQKKHGPAVPVRQPNSAIGRPALDITRDLSDCKKQSYTTVGISRSSFSINLRNRDPESGQVCSSKTGCYRPRFASYLSYSMASSLVASDLGRKIFPQWHNVIPAC